MPSRAYDAGASAFSSEEAAALRGARVIGRIEGFGAGYDPRQDLDDRREPYALTHAIGGALADAGVPPFGYRRGLGVGHGSPSQDARGSLHLCRAHIQRWSGSVLSLVEK